MALQKNGFTPEQINAPEAVLRVTEEGQPRWPTAIRIWPVMRGEDASHYVFIDVDAKCLVDLLCDPRSAKPWVTLFQLIDGLDKFWRRILGARSALPPSRDATFTVRMPLSLECFGWKLAKLPLIGGRQPS